jgi:hypothetical protein
MQRMGDHGEKPEVSTVGTVSPSSLPKRDFSLHFTTEIMEIIYWCDFLPFLRSTTNGSMYSFSVFTQKKKKHCFLQCSRLVIGNWVEK